MNLNLINFNTLIYVQNDNVYSVLDIKGYCVCPTYKQFPNNAMMIILKDKILKIDMLLI